MLKLMREREMLSVRDSDGKLIKELSVWNDFPAVYVDDLIEFMNSDEELIKSFLRFVLERRKEDLDTRKRELESLMRFVEGLE
ncbi:hypothetical protein [Thermococcus sp.]